MWIQAFLSFPSLLLPASPRRHTPLPVTLGSGCQMRTLDSGIGTFPLPDSVTRASGRHIPKSESSPEGVTAGSSELDRGPPSSHPDPSQPDVKVPSLPKTRLHAPTSMGHSLSDPSVTCSNNAQDTQSRLPKLATSGKSRTSSSSSYYQKKKPTAPKARCAPNLHPPPAAFCPKSSYFSHHGNRNKHVNTEK